MSFFGCVGTYIWTILAVHMWSSQKTRTDDEVRNPMYLRPESYSRDSLL